MSDFLLDGLQWPAMIITLFSTWCVASQTKKVRWFGFFSFIISNFLWVLWALHTEAYAIIVLQIGLLLLNIRGIVKNE